MDYLAEKKGHVLLFVTVTPKASKDEAYAVKTDALGQQRLAIRLNAVPEDGKANKALIAFIAKKTRIAKSYLSLASGHSHRNKNIQIELPFREALEKIQHLYPHIGEGKI